MPNPELLAFEYRIAGFQGLIVLSYCVCVCVARLPVYSDISLCPPSPTLTPNKLSI